MPHQSVLHLHPRQISFGNHLHVQPRPRCSFTVHAVQLLMIAPVRMFQLFCLPPWPQQHQTLPIDEGPDLLVLLNFAPCAWRGEAALSTP
eukprot:6824033-Pyramimonas_sp.AAC.1